MAFVFFILFPTSTLGTHRSEIPFCNKNETEFHILCVTKQELCNEKHYWSYAENYFCDNMVLSETVGCRSFPAGRHALSTNRRRNNKIIIALCKTHTPYSLHTRNISGSLVGTFRDRDRWATYREYASSFAVLVPSTAFQFFPDLFLVQFQVWVILAMCADQRSLLRLVLPFGS